MFFHSIARTCRRGPILCAALLDDDVLQVLVQSEGESDSDDRSLPSRVDIMNGLTLLSNVYEERTTLAQMQAGIIACKRNMKQVTF